MTFSKLLFDRAQEYLSSQGGGSKPADEENTCYGNFPLKDIFLELRIVVFQRGTLWLSSSFSNQDSALSKDFPIFAVIITMCSLPMQEEVWQEQYPCWPGKRWNCSQWKAVSTCAIPKDVKNFFLMK